jgi:hypothetical protein
MPHAWIVSFSPSWYAHCQPYASAHIAEQEDSKKLGSARRFSACVAWHWHRPGHAIYCLSCSQIEHDGVRCAHAVRSIGCTYVATARFRLRESAGRYNITSHTRTLTQRRKLFIMHICNFSLRDSLGPTLKTRRGQLSAATPRHTHTPNFIVFVLDPLMEHRSRHFGWHRPPPQVLPSLRRTTGMVRLALVCPDMFSTPPWKDRTVDVSDSSVTCSLKSFIRHVLKKVDSPLIREPPKQPPAKPVLLWRSRRLAAQSLS